jgi:ATP-dependent Clp protease ATP-binding subunit ClpX
MTLGQKLFEATSSVLGQEVPRKQLVNALDRHAAGLAGVRLPAVMVIVAGPTGAGKTFMIRRMCQASLLPFAEANATQFTEAGYQGLDLPQLYLPLALTAARDYDRELRLEVLSGGEGSWETPKRTSPLRRESDEELVKIGERASTGVILLDEFDKWLNRKDGNGRDIGIQLQAELLKLIEGDKVHVTDDDDHLGVTVDTSGVLIIACGAFVGLDKIVHKRLSRGQDRGVTDSPTAWKNVKPVDFINFGLMPELVGRIGSYVMLSPLSVETMLSILEAPGGLLDEYRDRFKAKGVEIEVDNGGKVALARLAQEIGVGARGLRFAMETVLFQALFQAGEGKAGKVRVTMEEVNTRMTQVV